MIISNLEEINSNIELLAPQSYRNISIIPIKSNSNTKLDLLTLKKGFELGLVEVKECEVSTVNTLIVKNNAVTPLILIDGEEVVGGDQNRLVNATTIIAAKSDMKVPVSCTEKGRWAYKSEFKNSNYIANYKTRRAKEYASRKTSSFQDTVWSSINDLEVKNSFVSPTSAMQESYEQLKIDHNKFIEEFSVADGQNGILIIVDGEIKGFEIFLNNSIYRAFHEKILKSYLIDAEIKDKAFAINIDTAHKIIADAFNSTFEKRESKGLEEFFDFENQEGLGKLYTFENEIVHISYFKKMEEKVGDEFQEDIALKTDI
ncbi:ARPP-1 family domain-containing protein [Methanobrevibacter sp.]|uniref:ARPP-1 family domain-containing protein n=1 Tax=Methanobrevibacter sp. TaxID=66852 RepID=UPI00386C21FB